MIIMYFLTITKIHFGFKNILEFINHTKYII